MSSPDKGKITNYFTKVKSSSDVGSNENNNNNNNNKNNNNNNNNNSNKRKQIERTDTIVNNTQLDYISKEIESNKNNKPKIVQNDEIEQTQLIDDNLPNQNEVKRSKNSNTTTTTTTTTTSTSNINNSNSNSNSNIDNKMEDIDDFLLEEQQSNTIFLIPLEGEKYVDVWNSDYVKLPCSKNNVYKATVKTTSRQSSGLTQTTLDGGYAIEDEIKTVTEVRYLSKWYLINTILSNPIKNSEAFEEAVKSYNQRSNWDFQGLHDFFETEFTESETNEFFSQTLPKIIKLALQLPFLCARPIPLLKSSVDREIILSQKQVSSLLANAFLCTFPRQGNITSNGSNSSSNNNHYRRGGNQDKFPSINFHSLFSGKMISSRAAKLKCIFHYFKCVTEKTPTGTISFHRQVFDESEIPDWERSTATLRDLTCFTEGTIEDNGIGMLQADFANKSLGGGVLGYGCVQEEIRFVINPELLVSCLFTSILQENETVIITGSQRFSKYTGYGDSFQWNGPYIDKTPYDQMGRRLTSIVAMDAIKLPHGGNSFQQFSPSAVERELNKSLCGFFDRVSLTIPPPVATGNWGCGVFGGDKHLKSIIQLMSGSQAGRDLVYFSFGDQEFTDELTQMISFLHLKKVTVGGLYKALWEYYKLISHTKSNFKLFSYLDAHFS
ncbi:hypothetical protein ACTFIW_003242 [Dictyostelium discoideum]